MNQDEINSQLENGEHLGLVLNAAQLESGTWFKRIVDVCKKAPDEAGLH